MAANIDYDRLASAAIRILKKAGSARTLVKKVKSGDAARPVITPVNHPCIGVEFDVESDTVNGTTVLDGDKLAYVAPSLTTEAANGDTYLDFHGTSYRIENVKKIEPNGVVVLWIYLLRK